MAYSNPAERTRGDSVAIRQPPGGVVPVIPGLGVKAVVRSAAATLFPVRPAGR
ncbi:MAG: hypothetical protein ACKO38_11245 [Planctomycetota bacterium]